MNVTSKCRNDLVQVTTTHAVALAAIHAAAFRSAESWNADQIAAQLSQPGVFGLIDPAGGMILARAAADEAEILTVAVAPVARRAGRGRSLLLAAEALAESFGARTMFLEVAAENAAARAMYAAAGYGQVGERRAYYPGGGNALVLARALRPGAIAGE